MNQQCRILVVDDEQRYVRVLKAILEGVGYGVLTAMDGAAALVVAEREPLDLILLDVRMPVMDGLETCRSLREFSLTPVIMLTALADEEDRVRGLDAGADDYVTKPFSAGELLARVRAVLRRAMWSETQSLSTIMRVGAVRLDLTTRRVYVDDREVALTATEFRLLRELARYPGRVFTPEQLLEGVWGPGYESEVTMVRQAVHRLRRKIEVNPTEPLILLSQTGMGYYLAG